ncbi:MAG TPA: RluA family pseudouridine synthase [Syntrophomonadaceae bacterium]|nr:RluA family pseudouridine synthase [Syntrophomonadaceae bacterium]
MKEIETLLVEENMEGERLDLFVSEMLENLSRSSVKLLNDQGKITVNGETAKASYRVREGDEVTVAIPEPSVLDIKPQDIPLNIIYQDEDVAVIDKPKGMVVHPAHGNWDNTLVNALMFHVKDLSGINGELRPGIVHRLDKDTSGVIVVAKNDIAHRSLAEQIRVHSINREYIALVHGNIKENLGRIEAPIGRSKVDRKKMSVEADGRPAISNYEVIERFGEYTLVRVKLLTGRTHQIRVHFSYIHHPVVGDQVYGSGRKHFNLDSQALHACLLGFQHPRLLTYMEFTSPLPGYFQTIIRELRK